MPNITDNDEAVDIDKNDSVFLYTLIAGLQAYSHCYR